MFILLTGTLALKYHTTTKYAHLSLQVSEAELDKLSYERFAYPHSMIQKRIFAVYLKAALQYRNEMIGLIVGLHYNVVSHWIEVYKAKGFKGLLSNNYGTNTSELASHGQSIFSSFASKPPMSARKLLYVSKK